MKQTMKPLAATVIIISFLLSLCGCFVVGPVRNKQAPFETTLPQIQGDFDTILAHGDGYYIVKKHIETYNTSEDQYGVLDDQSNWVTPLSANNYIAKAVDETMWAAYNRAYAPAEFSYLGEKMFAVHTHCVIIGESTIPEGYHQTYAEWGDCCVLNIEKKTYFRTGGYEITKFYDGYMFVKHSMSVERYDKSGQKLTLSTENAKREMYIGEPSMGLIYVYQRFYDIYTGKVKIDLTNYNVGEGYTLNNNGNISFNSNGTCTFRFYNPGGNRYEVEIDMNGNFVSDPRPSN